MDGSTTIRDVELGGIKSKSDSHDLEIHVSLDR